MADELISPKVGSVFEGEYVFLKLKCYQNLQWRNNWEKAISHHIFPCARQKHCVHVSPCAFACDISYVCVFVRLSVTPPYPLSWLSGPISPWRPTDWYSRLCCPVTNCVCVCACVCTCACLRTRTTGYQGNSSHLPTSHTLTHTYVHMRAYYLYQDKIFAGLLLI